MTAATLGYLAGILTTLAFVPQVLRVWRTRSAHDISGAMYALFIAGLALWIAYGVLLRAWPVVIANVVTILLAGAVLALKWHYARRGRGA
jgi:MtN3 and saliva related transmembrane protein